MEQNQHSSVEDVRKFFDSMPASFSNLAEGGIMEHHGLSCLPGYSAETLEYVWNWDMPENSVFVSSYPKTGTIWCCEIVRHILNIHDETTLQKSEYIPLLLERGPKERFDTYPFFPVPRKMFKTHMRENFFNFAKMKERKRKLIYTIRNPKDQAVSWFHFTQKYPLPADELKERIGTEWGDFLQKYLNGEHPTMLKKGEWYPDHILGWLKHRDDDSFLIVEYENLKKVI